VRLTKQKPILNRVKHKLNQTHTHNIFYSSSSRYHRLLLHDIKEPLIHRVEREIVGVLIDGSDIPWYLFGYQIRRQTAMFDLLSAEEYSFFLISD
jgi:hypothetical protein